MDLFDSSYVFKILIFLKTNTFITISAILVIQILSAIIIFPCGYLPVLCGALLGFKLGFLVALLATTLSVSVTFFIGYYFSKKNYFNKIKKNKIFTKILGDKKIQIDSSFKNMFIFFINPLLPGSSMGYLFGFSKASKLDFIYKSIVLSIPGCIITSGFGAGVIEEYFFGGTAFYFKVIICLFILIIIAQKIYSFLKKRESNEETN